MKTEMKKVWIYAEHQDGKNKVGVTSCEYQAKSSIECINLVRAPIMQIEIAVPVFSDSELNKVVHGSLLEQLIEERDKVKLEMSMKLERLNSKISDLQCLDFKVDGDDNT